MAIGNLKIENYVPAVRYNKGLLTKLPVSLSGTASTLAVGGTLAVTGTSTFTGVATFTAAPVFNGGRVSTVLASSGNTTITAATSGSTRLFDSAAGITYTLPAPIVGLVYEFVWTVSQSSSNHVVVTDAGTTFLLGGVNMFSATDITPSATLGPKFFAANGSTHIKYTSNATTTGTAIGSWLRFICVTATQWYVTGTVDSPSGSIATPFST